MPRAMLCALRLAHASSSPAACASRKKKPTSLNVSGPRASAEEPASPMRTHTMATVLALASCSHAMIPQPSRRVILRDVGAAAAIVLAPMATTAAMPSPPPMLEIDPSRFQKIPGGGRYADLITGSGPEVLAGSKVSVQWVLRRSNGYFVDGSRNPSLSKEDNFDEGQNFLFVVGDGTALPGIDAGIRGMRQGGTRRFVLPPKQAYTLPLEKSGGPLPSGFGPRRQIERELLREDPYNYFYLELQAVRVR